MTSDDLNGRLKEREEKRVKYLFAFYKIYDETGKPWVSRPLIAERSALDPKEAMEAHDYWAGKNFIVARGMGSQGASEILPAGIDAVEEEIRSRNITAKETNNETSENHYDIFISHSSEDKSAVTALIDLLRSSLNIKPEKILCTSVDGHRLGIGTRTEDELRNAIKTSTVFIGLLTEDSLASIYVLFELGARWGAGRRLFVMLAAGADPAILKDPLKQYNAGNCVDSASVHQLIFEIGKELQKAPTNAAAYSRHLDAFIQASKSKSG